MARSQLNLGSLLDSILLSDVGELAGKEESLGTGVGSVACKKHVVAGLYAPGEAHKHRGVAHEGEGHAFGDKFNRFVHVENSSDHEAPISKRAPEVDSAGSNWRVEEGEKLRCGGYGLGHSLVRSKLFGS